MATRVRTGPRRTPLVPLIPVAAAGAPTTEWQRSISPPTPWVPHGRALSFTIGREAGNDLVIDDPLVSKRHARVELTPVPVLVDLDSFHGSYVGGREVKGRAPLAPGVEVVLGNHGFTWDGTALVPRASESDFTLRAEALTTVVDGGKVLLDHVSLTLEPRSLTAVIGPSGAGKSTLLGALTGLTPATSGRVGWQGQDLYSAYERLRFQIGLVPQQDIQHPQLKVSQALRYAADLRLPPDTTREERAARVTAVAQALQLTERLENRIGTQLSGGQRKRVSIATELLTAPPLLFLDEPTSGLDPGLDVEVMRQLRVLADEGRVVVVVTHSVLALDTCDTVVVMAPGGRVAYVGPPDAVLAHFGCRTYPEVFDLLDEPDLWQRITAPLVAPVAPSVVPSPAPEVRPSRRLLLKQTGTLVRRNLAVISADRLLLGLLLVMPIVLGLLTRVVPGHGGLSLQRAPLGPGGLLSAREATQHLTLLVVIGSLMGTALTIRELVGERAIFQREYAVGLSTDAYLASKIAVFGISGFLQGCVVTAIATIHEPGPDYRGALHLGRLEIALIIGALTFAMAVVGLVLSALVTSTEQAMPALVGMVMVQIVLSGSLVDIAGRPVLSQLAWLAPARWAYAACSATTYLDRPVRALGGHLDWIAQGGRNHWLMDAAMIALLALVAAGIARVVVRRSAVSR